MSGDPAPFDALDHAEPLAGHGAPALTDRVDPATRPVPQNLDEWNAAASFDHAYALVIGISKYQHIASLPAVQDAQDVAETLTRHGGYALDNVRALIDESATRTAIVAELEALAGRDQKPSLLVFYFSGHGGARRDATGDDRDCYLMPVDGRWNDAAPVAGSALSGEELAMLVKQVGAERVIVILDCCRAESGALTKDVELPLERKLPLGQLHGGGRGRVVLAASGGDGYAFVRAGERNGVFTGHLLDGLRGACGGRGGVIDVADLYHYVQRKVAEEPEVQEPQFLSAVAGEMLAIARLPDHRHEPGPPPGPLDRRALQRALRTRLHRIEDDEPMTSPALGDIPADEVGRSGWRRVQSLRRALIESPEPVTVIEGGPGSGKSAFLHGFAVDLTDPAAPQQGSAGSAPLPLYVNLRDLEVPRGTPIDADLIEAFVVETWADWVPDLPAALRRDDSWLVLLDSFDEIPELLSSSGSDALATQYAEAIEAFADRSAGCRVIVASRPDYGPKRTSWTRYRLLPLGPERRREIASAFFRSAGKGDDAIERFLGELDASRLPGWRDSPLILNLICEHAAQRDALPTSLHDAFESFVARRVAARRDVLDRRRVTEDQLRLVAERVAFCMTARAQVGRALEIRELLSAMPACGLEASPGVSDALEALVELRLARGSVVPGVARDRFAFAHRRFQEYFAACCVCRGMAVAPVELLTDPRWREVAITVFQAVGPERVGQLLAHAADLLEQAVAALPACARTAAALPRSPVELERARQARSVGAFSWPEHSVHVLGIVSSLVAAWGPVEEQHGESARRVRRAADALLMACVLGGVRIDHAAAVELSGAANDPMRRLVLAWACSVHSEWLEDLAITQAATHDTRSLPVQEAVRRIVLRRALSGELRAGRVRTEARLRRVDQSGALVHTARWLLAAATVDGLCWGVLGCVYTVMKLCQTPEWSCGLGLMIAMICWLGTPRLLQWHIGLVDRVLVPRIPLGLTTSLVISAAPTILLRTIGAVVLLSPLAGEDPWSEETIIVAMLLGALRPFFCAAAGERHFGTAAWWRAVLDVAWKLGAVMLTLWYAVLAFGIAVIVAALIALSVAGESPLVVAAAFLLLVRRRLVRVVRRLLDVPLDRRMRRRSSSVGAEQLLLDASGYHSDVARLRYLRRVREAGLFQPGPHCEQILRDAIVAIERDRKIPWFRPRVPDPQWREPFATLYQTDLATFRGMARWFGGPLDELSSLLTRTVFPDQVAAEPPSAGSAAKP